MTRTFVISDTHFWHKNIIKYCDRPFDTVESMNAGMVERWNSVVGDNDEVWFLGDFAFSGKNKQLVLFEQLNGLIRVVPGNHDYVLKKLAKQDALPDNVRVYPELIKRKIDDRWFVLCHYPLEEWEGMAAHKSDTIGDAIHLHGHSHGTIGHTMDDRFDVGIDVYGKPIEITADLRYLQEPAGWH